MSTLATRAALALAPAAARRGRTTVTSSTIPVVSRRQAVKPRRCWRAAAASDDKDTSQKASPAEEVEDLPPWVRREQEKKAAQQLGDLPFGLYLLLSSFVAIAAVGSIFEFANKNPLFGVIEPDSPVWAPILLFFSITGVPMAGFLFVKAITAANKAAEAMDNLDGY
mmetsp:Transcript_14564/g.40977  ORF Transcript_14564/g.40977 Transcript_14564/m.40977 type:complete len:167 (-) Transcript_14564:171-671(-)|eukprot:CAMPEP_0117671856 /NCGR_PEP_ID=MMETSP0804-20121206/13576_1 /TAXON_ID=1074897 /ORGANISM="Tetraselmis astigmatica, Strain CCMP880" /LENGTH=166 /DNA_ID=CAMNT_0005480383 /DNA_START=120 /DNA_END=620 /DNA_ORIENTATION=-